MSTAFHTVTDSDFFAGTLAAVSSVRLFQPNCPVHVLPNPLRPLTELQDRLLRSMDGVTVEDWEEIVPPGYHVGAWELMAYTTARLAESGRYDVLASFDSDLVFCGPVDDALDRAARAGAWIGGRDPKPLEYGADYAIYGIDPPARNPKHMSASFFAVRCDEPNRGVLRRWTECVTAAHFNGRGPHPGGTDQAVLNAILFAEGRSRDVELLENSLWSQHEGAFWSDRYAFRDGRIVNLTAGGAAQRIFHSVSWPKFWQSDFRDKILGPHAELRWAYAWFLAMLWFGPARVWNAAPTDWLPRNCGHLADDLVNFFPLIAAVYPPAVELWNEAPPELIDAIVGPELAAAADPAVDRPAAPLAGRVAVCGPGAGASAAAAAVRSLSRDADFYAVEAFGADGRSAAGLPSRTAVLEALSRLHGLRARLLAGPPREIARSFDDGSLDRVLAVGGEDPAPWRTKVRPGEISAP